MLLLKVNPELKKVFSRLIGTIKAPVTWKNVIAVVNNNLILVGEVRSLIFNFENKKVYTNIIDIPLENKIIEQVPNETLINNMINMTLYAFGKWGSIGGLKVEKDYAALNALFQSVFRPIGVEPGFRSENFRFYKNGMQITYEEAITAAMQLLKDEGKVQSQEEDKEKINGVSDEEEEENQARETDSVQGGKDDQWMEEDYELGLWHKLCWKIKSYTFKKSPQSESDVVKSRIGNNFYMTDYECPECGEKLYMGVYPVDRELLIETEEARVFMARAYACNSCNMFYTPRPGKLLQEGDVYCIKFDEDRIAYEDYLEILGHKAAKTVNYKFNEYESERKKGKDIGANKDIADEEQAVSGAGEILLQEEKSKEDSLEMLKQKFGNKQVAQKQLGKEQMQTKEAKLQNDKVGLQDADKPNYKTDVWESEQPNYKSSLQEEEQPEHWQEQEQQVQYSGSQGQGQPEHAVVEKVRAKLEVKTTEELKALIKDMENGVNGRTAVQRPEGMAESEYLDTVRETLKDKLTAKYDARMGALTNLTFRQLSDLKKQLKEEQNLPEESRQAYIKKIDSKLYLAEEKALEQKIELSKNKTYEEINRIIEDVSKGDSPEDLKQETIQRLKRIRSDRAEREVEHLIFHIPLHLDRKQLAVYLDKLEQYKEVDMGPYRKRIEERRDMAEKEEIAAFVNRGGKKDRQALWELYGQLQEQDYKKENKEPFLEKIYEKIRKMDEDEIESICPSIPTMTFAEGMAAYEKISQTMLLPELKTNTLDMIERRITKLKTDESVQLMRKLKHDMEDKMSDLQGFYFYDAREELRRERAESRQKNVEDDLENAYHSVQDEEQEQRRASMYRAINGYAAGRNPYEYPILVGDITRTENGKEGFVLTPEHIFYHSLFNSGVIGIMDIDKVEENKGLIGKGIYVKRFMGKKCKLPNPVKPENWSAFAEILNEYVDYLQERPESRSVEYLSKEKHEVKCCYRCGFTYKGGNVCPKCGSKMNN